MLTWDGYRGENAVDPMASLDGDLAMLVDSADEAAPDPDEKRWFARQTRQKQAQKLYRHALPTVSHVVQQTTHPLCGARRRPLKALKIWLVAVSLRIMIQPLTQQASHDPRCWLRAQTCMPHRHDQLKLARFGAARSSHAVELVINGIVALRVRAGRNRRTGCPSWRSRSRGWRSRAGGRGASARLCWSATPSSGCA